MAQYDLVIKNGTVVDGTGLPRFVADIGIADGVIQEIGQIPASKAAEVIDAQGRVVAPGAIDNHTHFDTQIHWDPYCTPNSWHGYTSVVATNCGFGFAPCVPEMRDRYMRMMEATEQVSYTAAKAALPWDWESYPEYMAHMRRIPKGVNIAQYFPLNPALCYVMGVEEAKVRAATKAEMVRLKDLLNRAMDAGAIGFSFCHLLNLSSHVDADGTPMPTDVHPPEDFYKLAEVLRERGQGMIQAMTDLPGVSTRQVAAEIARASRRTVLHNTVGPYDGEPEFHAGILRFLDECEAEGLDVYSFTPGRPDVAIEGNLDENNSIEVTEYFRAFSRASNEEKTRMASDPAFLEGARAAYDPVAMGGVVFAFENMVLSNPCAPQGSLAKYKGATLGDIATAEKSNVVDIFFRAVAESRAAAEFRVVAFQDSLDAFREVWAHPRVIVGGTDGGAHLKMVTIGDTSSEILGSIVRRHKIATLEQAHLKMSGLVARVFGLRNRGLLREGYAADIMVYDPETIGSTKVFERTYDLPDGGYRKTVRGKGMDWVIVNGEVIFRGGQCTGRLPGRLIGNGRQQPAELLDGLSRLAAE